MIISRWLFLICIFSVSACSVQNNNSYALTKRIAISFDDAPLGSGPLYSGEERTNALISSLASVDARPVAIFVTTQGLSKSNGHARVKQYAAAGHLIANHSNTHKWASRTELEEYLADIDKAESLLKGFENRRPWYRFPFLDEGRPIQKRDAIRLGLDARGLKNGYVTVDNYDWYLQAKWNEAVENGKRVNMDALRDLYIAMLLEAANFYDEAAVKTLKTSPVHMLLLHENDLAAAFIDDVISAFRADGWEIVNPDTAYADPISTKIPATLFTNQGHVAALAHEAGMPNTHFNHWSIDELKIDERIHESQVFNVSRAEESSLIDEITKAEKIDDNIEVTELADGVWMHTTYRNLPSLGPFPSNGLIIEVDENKAVLVDTAWNDKQTEAIMTWIEHRLKRKLIAAVVTHAHDDKMGGVGALRASNISTYAHPMSNILAPQRGLVAAEYDLKVDLNGDVTVNEGWLPNVTIFYPGPGHSADNIVVKVDDTDVLFGGCLIRPAISFSLGSIKHANIEQWGSSVSKVATRFPNASIVVPSHGHPSERELLNHTSKIVRKSVANL